MIKEDITTCMVDLPTSIKSYVVAMLDNRFCIVLNSRMDYESLVLAYQHELAHIMQHDFDKSNADTIELKSHNI